MQYVNVFFYYINNIDRVITDEPNSTKYYTYKNDLKLNLKENDIVLVRANDTNCAIAKVVRVFSSKQYNECTTCPKDRLESVVGIIDVSKARKNYEKSKKIEEFDKIIQEKYEQMSKLNLLRQMASNGDEELKQMIKEYEDLLNDK